MNKLYFMSSSVNICKFLYLYYYNSNGQTQHKLTKNTASSLLPQKTLPRRIIFETGVVVFFVVFLWHRNDWTCNHCISTAFLSATTATFRVYSFSQGVFTETEQNDQSLPLQRNNRLSSNTSINSEQQHSFQKPRTSLPTVSGNTSRNFPVSFFEFELDWWHGTVTQFQSSLTDGVICMRHATSEALYLRPAF